MYVITISKVTYLFLKISVNIFTEPEEEEVGNYDEASIRYKGGNIPSKSFKILQNMTGGAPPPRPCKLLCKENLEC